VTERKSLSKEYIYIQRRRKREEEEEEEEEGIPYIE
jgi:hypothetical protein